MEPFEAEALGLLKGALDQREAEFLSPMAAMRSHGRRREPEVRPGAYRQNFSLDVDRILVIRQGEIIEQGTHSELLLANGYYTRLFHLQFKNKNGVSANVA